MSSVVPLDSFLQNSSVSSDPTMSENSLVNPVMSGDSNTLSAAVDSVRALDPVICGNVSVSQYSPGSHNSMSSPNLLAGGPSFQTTNSVSPPDLVGTSDFSSSSPSFQSANSVSFPDLVSTSDLSIGVPSPELSDFVISPNLMGSSHSFVGVVGLEFSNSVISPDTMSSSNFLVLVVIELLLNSLVSPNSERFSNSCVLLNRFFWRGLHR